MEEISLEELFHILKKKIGLIIILTVLAMIISAIISFFVLDPEYKTFTTLMVGRPKDYQLEEQLEYNDLLLNQKLVPTYGALVQSREVGDKVIENLELEMSYETFSNKVNVNLLKDTEIIKLEVTDESPELAADIANETANVFMDAVRRIMNIENIQIIDKAQIPVNPIKPRPALNIAIAGVLGLMLGIFLVYLQEYLDKTIKRPEDVERILDLPVIGIIPEINEADKIISISNSKSPVAESFRTLRTNIQYSQIDDDIETILVTSSMPGEGKSTVAANLAATMAMADKKVLIMDCDLRKPKISKIFGYNGKLGLTNVLLGSIELEELIMQHDKLENLYILPAGTIPPNPAELIASRKMQDLIDRLKKEYDIIIIDTPPVGVVTDGVILSTKTDGIVMVTSSGETDIEMAQRGKELIDNVGTRIIGGVLNKVKIEGNSYYNKYAYYSYYED